MNYSSTVLIIGAGPSSLFAAKRLLEETNNISVIIVEKGKSPQKRHCVLSSDVGDNKCEHCDPCQILHGGGGCGLFSDGKLVLDLESGGNAKSVMNLSNDDQQRLIQEIEQVFTGFDGMSDRNNCDDEDSITAMQEILFKEDLQSKFYPVLHMGSKNLGNITTNFIKYLERFKNRFQIFYNTEVQDFTKTEDRFFCRTDKDTFTCEYLVLAVGKAGATWSQYYAEQLGCHYSPNFFYIGLRTEFISDVLYPLMKLSFDPKIWKEYPDGQKIKTHCVCRNGSILIYKYKGYSVVGGHTLFTKKDNSNKRDNGKSNMNILLSYRKDDLQPQEFLDYFKELSVDTLLVQKLSDFRRNKKTEQYGKISPDDTNIVKASNIRTISNKIPKFSDRFLGFIDSLNNVVPGIADDDNLLYGPAIEWWMDRIELDEFSETDCPGLYSIGDGSGTSQGIVYASATGMIAANSIIRKENARNQ